MMNTARKGIRDLASGSADVELPNAATFSQSGKVASETLAILTTSYMTCRVQDAAVAPALFRPDLT